MAETERSAETPRDYGTGAEGEAKRWHAEIALAEKDCDKWWKRGDKIVKRYKDERSSDADESSKLNIFWSNVQTLLPTLYSRTPKPDIGRRWKDQDPLGRLAAEVLDRAASYTLTAYDFDSSVRAAVLDYALTGRGVAWVRYEPSYRDAANDPGQVVTAESNEGDKKAEPDKEVDWEKCCVDHVNRRDFLHNPARTWNEVRWVARKAYLTRDELIKRFGKIGKDVPLDHKPASVSKENEGQAEYQAFKKATVYEIWDKPSRKAIWVAKELKDKLIDSRDDPLMLQGFFPCPKPAFATLGDDSILPVPDYIQYQDLCIELDSLSQRIVMLNKAVKAAGVYDASQEGIKRLLDEGVDNELIPVTTWGAFAEKGGLKGTIDWLPLDQIVTALNQLYLAREQVKQSIYEITGISDIIRGASNPNETLGAQEIKSQYGGMRLQDRQGEIQRFARDIVRLVSELIAEHFSPATLKVMTGLKIPTREEQALQMQQQVMQQPGQPPQPPSAPQPTWEDVLELLKSDGLRSFRIDIETDSTVQADQQLEKEARVEFIAAMGSFLEQAGAIGQMQPALVPALGETMLFGIRGFRAGRSLEEEWEKAIDQLRQQAASPQPKPPSPEEIKAKSDAELADKNLQLKDKDLQLKSMDVEIKQTEAGVKNQELANQQLATMAESAKHKDALNAQLMQDGMPQMVQAFMQIAQAMTAAAQAMQQSAMAVTAAANAPKQVTVQRDGAGRIAGATATTATIN